LSDIRQSVEDYVKATQELLKQGNDLSNEELQAIDERVQQVLVMLKENGWEELD
jgi:hypothetical protein